MEYIKEKEKEKSDLVTNVLMKTTELVESQNQKRRIKEMKKK